ncbi:hypothetical protein [Deinococcus sp. Leaf326]|uniref:hypothetical protein n=1 Tax=Deinococcus sp. Leaf326 TaxID=1736338 RepID=UPI0006FBA8B9|nr:hypothetical protein [Deinococcus sp. Leaf326]KQR40790.1 hypothetical protein ASF71_01070 [Deinococcus sp. Leaf326]
MPQVDALVDVLSEMFAAAGSDDSSHRRLSSGLHVKVGTRGARRMVIVWRDGDRLPGRTECQVVGEDAGFYAPKYRSWKVQKSADAFLIEEGYQGELCRHEWATPTEYVVKRLMGYTATCLICGAVWRQEKRAKSVAHVYNGETRREPTFDRFLILGPVPANAEALAPQAPQAAPVVSQPAVRRDAGEVAALLHMSHKERRAQKEREVKRRKDAIEQARTERERPVVARYVRVLTLCALGSAVRHPGWFSRPAILQARVAWIKGAKLPELREDLHSRHGRSMLAYSVTMLLLILRWPQIMRALPAEATAATAAAPAKAAKKPRAPRKPRTKAGEAA